MLLPGGGPHPRGLHPGRSLWEQVLRPRPLSLLPSWPPPVLSTTFQCLPPTPCLSLDVSAPLALPWGPGPALSFQPTACPLAATALLPLGTHSSGCCLPSERGVALSHLPDDGPGPPGVKQAAQGDRLGSDSQTDPLHVPSHVAWPPLRPWPRTGSARSVCLPSAWEPGPRSQPPCG